MTGSPVTYGVIGMALRPEQRIADQWLVHSGARQSFSASLALAPLRRRDRRQPIAVFLSSPRPIAEALHAKQLGSIPGRLTTTAGDSGHYEPDAVGTALTLRK